MDDIENMIQDCLRRESKMNDWEKEFMQSIEDQYNDRGTLTDRQSETLEEIWDRIT